MATSRFLIRNATFLAFGLSLAACPPTAMAEQQPVFVFVHGVEASGQDDSTSYGSLQDAIQIKLNERGFSPLFIRFDWGVESMLNATGRAGTRTFQVAGSSDRQWAAIAKLKEVLAQLHSDFGNDISTTLVSHSQGTVVSMMALAEGAKVDNWITMGSVIGQGPIAQGSRQLFQNELHYRDAVKNVTRHVLNFAASSDVFVLGAAREVRDAAVALVSGEQTPGGSIGRIGLPFIYYQHRAGSKIAFSGTYLGIGEETGSRSRDPRYLAFQLILDREAPVNSSDLRVVNVPIDVDRIPEDQRPDTFLWEHSIWWDKSWLNHGHAWPANFQPEDFLSLLIKGDSSETLIEEEALNSITKLALEKIDSDSTSELTTPRDDQWRGFGESSPEGAVSRRFTVTKGLRTGLHIDDARSATFSVKCLDDSSSVTCQLKVATWAEWETDLAIPRSPRALSGNGSLWTDVFPPNGSDPSSLDKTVYLEVTGVSEVSHVELVIATSRSAEAKSGTITNATQGNQLFEVRSTTAAIGRYETAEDDEKRATNLGEGLKLRHSGKDGNAWLIEPDRAAEFSRDAFFENTTAIDGEPISVKRGNAKEALLKAEEANQAALLHPRNANRNFLNDQMLLVSLQQEGNAEQAAAILDEELLKMNAFRNQLRPYLDSRLAELSEAARNGEIEQSNVGGILYSMPGDAYRELIGDQQLAAKLRIFVPLVDGSNKEKQSLLELVLSTVAVQESGIAKAALSEYWAALSRNSSQAVADPEIAWIRKNRQQAKHCVRLIESALAAHEKDAAIEVAIDRYLGGAIRVPSGAFSEGRAHLKLQLDANAGASEARGALQARVYLCLPPMYGDISHEWKPPEGINVETIGENVRAHVFEEIDLGITADGLRIDPIVWDYLGRLVALEHRYTDAGISHDTMLRSSPYIQSLDTLQSAIEFLAKERGSDLCVLGRPKGNAQFGIGKGSREQLRRLFSSWDIPDWMLGSVKSFDLDRERFAWIEFGLALRIPFTDQPVTVPVRIDLTKGVVEGKKLREAIREAVMRAFVKACSRSAQIRDGGIAMFGGLSFRYGNIAITYNESQRTIDVAGELEIARIAGRPIRPNVPEFGKWKLECTLGGRDRAPTDGKPLLNLPLPGFNYALNLERASLIDGESIKPASWFDSGDFSRAVSAARAGESEPNAESDEAKPPFDDLAAKVSEALGSLAIENLRLQSGLAGIEVSGSLSAGRENKPSSRVPFRSNLHEFDKSLPSALIALSTDLLRGEVVSWAAANISVEATLTKSVAESLNKLRGVPLSAGPITIVFGEVKVWDHQMERGEATAREAVHITEVTIDIDDPIGTSLRIADLQVLVGDDNATKAAAEKLIAAVAGNGGLSGDAVRSFLSSLAAMVVDTSQSRITVDGVDYTTAASDLIPAVSTTLQQPVFLHVRNDAEVVPRTVGIGIPADLSIDESVSEALDITFPKVRFCVDFTGVFRVEIETVDGTWKDAGELEAGKAFQIALRQIVMKAAAKTMSAAVAGETLNLLGLGKWQFNTKDADESAVDAASESGAFEFVLRGTFLLDDGPDSGIAAEVSLPSLRVSFLAGGLDPRELLANFLSDLCGAGIAISNIRETRNPVGIVFDIEGNLESLGAFRMRGVQLTTRRILLPKSVTVRAATPIAVATGLWLCDAGITVPLNGDLMIGVEGAFALVEPNTKRLLKLDSEAAVEIVKDLKLLRATASARTVLLTVMPVMQSEGVMELGEGVGSVELESKTLGPLAKLVNFRNSLSIQSEVGELNADGRLEVLGFTVGDGHLLIAVKPKSVTVDLTGEVNVFDTMKSSMSARCGTGFGLEKAVFTSMQGLPLGKIAGSDINLGSVRIEATRSESLISFRILSASLSLRAPPLQSLTIGWLKKEIERFLRQGLLDLLDPKKVAKAIEQIASGNVTIQPGGTLGGGGGGGNTGNTGNNNGNNNGSPGGPPPDEPGNGDGTGPKPGSPANIPTVEPEPGELLIASMPQSSLRVVKHDNGQCELRWVTRGHNFLLYQYDNYRFCTEEQLADIKRRGILAIDWGWRTHVLLLGPDREQGDFGALIALGYHWTDKDDPLPVLITLRNDELKKKREGLPSALNAETVATGLFRDNSLFPTHRGQYFSKLEENVVRQMISAEFTELMNQGGIGHEWRKEQWDPEKRWNYWRPQWATAPADSTTELVAISESSDLGDSDAVIQAVTVSHGIKKLELRRWSDNALLLSLPATDDNSNSLAKTLTGGAAPESLVQFAISKSQSREELSLFANATDGKSDLQQYLFGTIPNNGTPVRITRLTPGGGQRSLVLHAPRFKPPSKRGARTLFSPELVDSAEELRRVVHAAASLDSTKYPSVEVYTGRTPNESTNHEYAIVACNLDGAEWKAVLLTISREPESAPKDAAALEARLLTGESIAAEFSQWIASGLVTDPSLSGSKSLPPAIRRRLIEIVTSSDTGAWKSHFKVDPQGLFVPRE